MRRAPCIGCGGPKPAGRGLRYCDDCERRPCGDTQTPCHMCGTTENKPRKAKYCRDCKTLRDWRYKTRRHAKTSQVRKPCEHCGGNKGPGTGQRLCPACKAKLNAPPTCIRCKQDPVRSFRAHLCVRCWKAAGERKRELAAARQRERLRAGPAEVRAPLDGAREAPQP